VFETVGHGVATGREIFLYGQPEVRLASLAGEPDRREVRPAQQPVWKKIWQAIWKHLQKFILIDNKTHKSDIQSSLCIPRPQTYIYFRRDNAALQYVAFRLPAAHGAATRTASSSSSNPTVPVPASSSMLHDTPAVASVAFLDGFTGLDIPSRQVVTLGSTSTPRSDSQPPPADVETTLAASYSNSMRCLSDSLIMIPCCLNGP